MIPAIPALLVVGAAAWWFFSRAPNEHEPDEDSDSYGVGGGGVTYADGLTTANLGIKLNERQIAFCIKLRKECSKDIVPDIVITSGLRTYASQLTVMRGLYQRDPKGFADLYKQAASELIASSEDAADWTVAQIESLYDRGILHKSGHTSGGAVDLRSRDLSKAQIAEMQRAVKACGGSSYIDIGPCLHVDLPKVTS